VTPHAVTGKTVVALRDRLDDSEVSALDIDEVAVARYRLLRAGPVSAEHLDEDP
jgi:hypothetical protein